MFDTELRLNALCFVDQWLSAAGIGQADVQFQIERALSIYIDYVGLNLNDAADRTLLSVIDSLHEPLASLPDE
jgi:hypothetical protein